MFEKGRLGQISRASTYELLRLTIEEEFETALQTQAPADGDRQGDSCLVEAVQCGLNAR